ncbi:MAG TPA: YciI family protein [Acidobacteriota bacterium]|nr:YciI family protein [Acidobacteriota bacterium]
MKYLLIISHDNRFAPNENLLQDIGTWIAKMKNRGVRVSGNPLRPPNEATTVRVREGKVVLKKGPFANSKEKMCAYELIECSGDTEAIEIASLHPMAKVATIEVRPIWKELVDQ